MKATNPIDWLCEAVTQHRELAQDYSHALADEFWRNQPEFRSAEDSLNGRVERSRHSPLEAAHEHWKTVEPTLHSKAQRLRHLWLILDCLNKVYANVPIQKRGSVVLGRRWWNHATRLDRSPDGKGILDDRPPVTAGYPFPHLRIVDVKEDEWFGLAECESAFAPVLREGVLRVGLCCLSGKARTHFRSTRKLPHHDNTMGFVADGIRWDVGAVAAAGVEGAKSTDVRFTDQQYLDELCECLQWSRDSKVHILCLPELCVCEQGRELLQREIEKYSGDLCLVIPGSYHVSDNESSLAANAAPLWLIEDGCVRTLPDYQKADPMNLELSRRPDCHETLGLRHPRSAAQKKCCAWLREDIREGNKIRLLYTPVGLIGILICKDLLWTELTHLRRYAELADLLIVVSMNDTPGRFWHEAPKLSDRGTAVVYVNTPQLLTANDSETEVVFWHIPPVKEPLKTTETGATRVCRYRLKPVDQARGGLRQAVSPSGRELCELDFRDVTFFGLMTGR